LLFIGILQLNVQMAESVEILNYGCVLFEEFGLDYFLYDTSESLSPDSCASKCLSKDEKYQFFILSYFPEGFYCDCFYDDSENINVVNDVFCGIKCNDSCL